MSHLINTEITAQESCLFLNYLMILFQLHVIVYKELTLYVLLYVLFW